MPALARGQANSIAAPALVGFTLIDGVIMDVEEASYEVRRGATVVVAKTALNVVDDRLALGQYVAPYTVGAAEPLGDHEIEWFYKETAASDELSYIQEFEVLTAVPGPLLPRYATVTSLRDEGVDENEVADGRLALLVALASQYAERYTGRFFEPRGQVIKVDGHGSPVLRVGHPIISVGEVTIEAAFPAVEPVIEDLDSLKIYNRHLTQNLIQPDDRDSPKIEFVHTTRGQPLFTRGQQNIQITGVFGFTDPENAVPVGRTPALLEHATRLLALRQLPTLTQTDARRKAQRAWRVLEDKSGDSGYKLLDMARGTIIGGFSGDPEIDQILASFSRPPAWRAA